MPAIITRDLNTQHRGGGGGGGGRGRGPNSYGRNNNFSNRRGNAFRGSQFNKFGNNNRSLARGSGNNGNMRANGRAQNRY